MKALYARLADIVLIKVIDKQVNHNNYKYIDETRDEEGYEKWYHRLIFKKTITKTHYQGYYQNYYGDEFSKYQTLYTADQLRSSGLLVDESQHIVYNKPSIEFTFRSGNPYRKEFNTIEEIDIFLQPLLLRNKELLKIVG